MLPLVAKSVVWENVRISPICNPLSDSNIARKRQRKRLPKSGTVCFGAIWNPPRGLHCEDKRTAIALSFAVANREDSRFESCPFVETCWCDVPLNDVVCQRRICMARFLFRQRSDKHAPDAETVNKHNSQPHSEEPLFGKNGPASPYQQCAQKRMNRANGVLHNPGVDDPMQTKSDANAQGNKFGSI